MYSVPSRSFQLRGIVSLFDPSISFKVVSLIASSNENMAFLLEIYKMTSSIDMHCRTVVENTVLSKMKQVKSIHINTDENT